MAAEGGPILGLARDLCLPIWLLPQALGLPGSALWGAGGVGFQGARGMAQVEGEQGLEGSSPGEEPLLRDFIDKATVLLGKGGD